MFVFKAAVVGAGTMGGEIAQVIAAAEVPVVLKDVEQKFVDAGLDKAREVAATVAANGPLAVEAILQTLRATEHMSEEEAFAFEQPIGMSVMASTDSKEGPKAFAEKRTPNFQRK